MRPTNLLVILSDEHSREVLGCYGNKLVQTPHIDRLAGRGTLFESAYCNSPICVPARASLATGRYVHDNMCWDNAHPYYGQLPSWGHRLIDSGHEVVSIGKLHYRSSSDGNGFKRELIPLHILDGVGDPLGSIRRPPAPRGGIAALAEDAGPGQSNYYDYDRKIMGAACEWLTSEASHYEKPWVLFVSFVQPHHPLIALPEYFEKYPLDSVPLPRLYGDEDRSSHPVIHALERCLNYDDYFDTDRVRTAIAAYYGMVTCLDDNIGRVLGALEASGQTDNTRIMYSSDHGESLGNRGLWGKFTMYEESVGVPLILAGPDIPRGHVCSTPVTHVDVFPTVIEATGNETHANDRELPGCSLLKTANRADEDRVVLSEYHAVGSVAGYFMIRKGNWKYVHYVGYPPQLFDLAEDPLEEVDLGDSAEHQPIRDDCEAALRTLVNPEAVNKQVFSDQAKMIERYGGLDRVRKRGDFGHSPVPGQEPKFASA